ncbi:hypothetical protein [endosymbiont of Riftia pachyptila]|uniref:Uncharacterized protein n=1 Tax=endosymbiont of Riftia pachyptila (vent Ph05) TaxID=1048808 RepID=G2DGT8_9GAMM|nr:hypothetical protein [endosymbiont of Riftia pachyptila]EGV50158.1 hypothetical protein Rifp1Sym_dx00030 [endosymbiont of Riftia pachyptila (vent Ph05)]
MAIDFKFWADAGLAGVLTQISSQQLVDGSSAANDFIVYFGAQSASVKAENSTDPGTAQLQVTVASNVADWAAGAVAANQIMKPTVGNGYKYQAQGSGTAVTEPAWPTTIGATVAQDGITYECIDEIHEPAECVLSADSAGLGTNTPGAALDIGVSVTGGVAVPIYLRVDQGAHPFGTYTDIKLVVPDLLQSAI